MRYTHIFRMWTYVRTPRKIVAVVCSNSSTTRPKSTRILAAISVVGIAQTDTETRLLVSRMDIGVWVNACLHCVYRTCQVTPRPPSSQCSGARPYAWSAEYMKCLCFSRSLAPLNSSRLEYTHAHGYTHTYVLTNANPHTRRHTHAHTKRYSHACVRSST